MPSMPDPLAHTLGPTAAELRAIESEEPLLSAELDVLDAEIRLISTKHPSDLDWRRLLRAEAALTRAATEHLTLTRAGRRRPTVVAA